MTAWVMFSWRNSRAWCRTAGQGAPLLPAGPGANCTYGQLGQCFRFLTLAHRSEGNYTSCESSASPPRPAGSGCSRPAASQSKGKVFQREGAPAEAQEHCVLSIAGDLQTLQGTDVALELGDLLRRDLESGVKPETSGALLPSE